MKTKTDLNGPENSDRKALKRADHGPKNSDTYSYQVGGDDAPWEKANDTALSPMDWATPKVIEVKRMEKTTIQAFWN
jgi:hypothetical protein